MSLVTQLAFMIFGDMQNDLILVLALGGAIWAYVYVVARQGTCKYRWCQARCNCSVPSAGRDEYSMRTYSVACFFFPIDSNAMAKWRVVLRESQRCN